jgi:GntR family transcriptional regulator, transcriptional repressor for pyruvate dehydrogenase complex
MSGLSNTQALLSFIREKRIEPGDRLPSERMLAGKLSVSRNSLREAVAVLSSLRVLDVRPNSGVYLRHVANESSFEQMVLQSSLGAAPSSQEILDTMEVRIPLETQALRLACERRDETDLDAIKLILIDERAALARGENTVQFDQAFHLRVVAAAHNSVLLRLLNSFYQLTLVRRERFFANPDRARESARDHRRILKAIERKDADEATRLVTNHMQRARLYWSLVNIPS